MYICFFWLFSFVSFLVSRATLLSKSWQRRLARTCCSVCLRCRARANHQRATKATASRKAAIKRATITPTWTTTRRSTTMMKTTKATIASLCLTWKTWVPHWTAKWTTPTTQQLLSIPNEERREMISDLQRKTLSKQGYQLIGSHSAVKMCRWTKAQLRGRGGCYKHTFYGITSYQVSR